MKIGLFPRLDATKALGNNHTGPAEVRWSSNIYHYLKMLGLNVEYIPHNRAQDCDVYFDVSTREQCDECNAKRHVHLTYYTIDNVNHPHLRECVDGRPTIYGNAYRKIHTENSINPVVGRNVFCPIPYPVQWRAEIDTSIRPFDRNEITWAVRKTTIEWKNNMEAALERFKRQHPEVKINYITAKEGTPGRLPWEEVMKIQARTKINLYCDDESGACTNEAMFCGALPLFPRNNKFWYVPDSSLTCPVPQTSEEMYNRIEEMWSDEELYCHDWDYYQRGFSDHYEPKLEKTWRETLDYLRTQPVR